MPLPVILVAAAAVAGAVGIKKGVEGASKIKEANETMKAAENRHERNIRHFEKQNRSTLNTMDDLGTFELTIVNHFEKFSDIIEQIQNRPEFKAYRKNGITLPKYNKEELKKASIGAGILLGGLSGAALGTAGGFAAAGVTTSAVMALGTASTGTAIASLSGAAATNATLAALGGGALGSSAFAGGMALGSTILGAATLGVGLLVGGAIFSATGDQLSSQADEAYQQMKIAEETINKACSHLAALESAAKQYYDSLQIVYDTYMDYYNRIYKIVISDGRTNWNEYTSEEKIDFQNAVLLVGLLYKMCKVSLVKKATSDTEISQVNDAEITATISDSVVVLQKINSGEAAATLRTINSNLALNERNPAEHSSSNSLLRILGIILIGAIAVFFYMQSHSKNDVPSEKVNTVPQEQIEIQQDEVTVPDNTVITEQTMNEASEDISDQKESFAEIDTNQPESQTQIVGNSEPLETVINYDDIGKSLQGTWKNGTWFIYLTYLGDNLYDLFVCGYPENVDAYPNWHLSTYYDESSEALISTLGVYYEESGDWASRPVSVDPGMMFVIDRDTLSWSSKPDLIFTKSGSDSFYGNLKVHYEVDPSTWIIPEETPVVDETLVEIPPVSISYGGEWESLGSGTWYMNITDRGDGWYDIEVHGEPMMAMQRPLARIWKIEAQLDNLTGSLRYSKTKFTTGSYDEISNYWDWSDPVTISIMGEIWFDDANQIHKTEVNDMIFVPYGSQGVG